MVADHYFIIISEYEIKVNYNDVRKSIIDELRRRNIDIPDDYEALP